MQRISDGLWQGVFGLAREQQVGVCVVQHLKAPATGKRVTPEFALGRGVSMIYYLLTFQPDYFLYLSPSNSWVRVQCTCLERQGPPGGVGRPRRRPGRARTSQTSPTAGMRSPAHIWRFLQDYNLVPVLTAGHDNEAYSGGQSRQRRRDGCDTRDHVQLIGSSWKIGNHNQSFCKGSQRHEEDAVCTNLHTLVCTQKYIYRTFTITNWGEFDIQIDKETKLKQ